MEFMLMAPTTSISPRGVNTTESKLNKTIKFMFGILDYLLLLYMASGIVLFLASILGGAETIITVFSDQDVTNLSPGSSIFSQDDITRSSLLVAVSISYACCLYIFAYLTWKRSLIGFFGFNIIVLISGAPFVSILNNTVIFITLFLLWVPWGFAFKESLSAETAS